MPRLVVWLAALALVAVACGGSSTGDDAQTDDDQTEQAQAEEAQAGEEPDADPADGAADAEETADTETEDPTDAANDEETADTEAVDPVVPADDEETADTEAAVLADSTAEVVVLDPGAEPRVELRFAIAPTCSELVTITQIQELTQVIDSTPVPSDGAIGNVIDMQVTTQLNGDNFDTRSEIIDARAGDDVPAALATQIDTALEAMTGVTTLQTITPRGELVPGSSRVEGADALGQAEAMLQGINQSQAPFPVEPVGVGAQWQTTTALEVQGVEVISVTTTEVVSIDGTTIELAIAGTQDVAENTAMNLGGVTADVLIWEASTTAEITIDLLQVSPIQSSVSTTLIQQLDFQGDAGLLDQEVVSEAIQASTGTGCTTG